MQTDIIGALQKVAINGEVACVDAHRIACDLSVSPTEAGKAANRATDLRFYRCQLGLFGYGLKAEGKHKIVMAATVIPLDIEAALRANQVNNTISCESVWQVAEQFKYPRLGLANIVQALGFKVTACQLGCF